MLRAVTEKHGHELHTGRQLVLEGDLLKQLRISDALVELVFSPLRSVEDVMDTYFADDYVHCMNGIPRSRVDFAAMASRARSTISHGAVTTLDELRDGQSYAERTAIAALDLASAQLDRVDRTAVEFVAAVVQSPRVPDSLFARSALPSATVKSSRSSKSAGTTGRLRGSLPSLMSN